MPLRLFIPLTLSGILNGPTNKLASPKKVVLFDALFREVQKGMPSGKAIANVFEILAEEHLIDPHIIYDFPLAVSPLSKKKPDEPDWVERFEFYIGGFEVGNAFSELNDPDDQRSRFEAQMTEKNRGDARSHGHGRGLRPSPRLRSSPHRRRRHRHRPPSPCFSPTPNPSRDVILFPLLRPQAKQTNAPGPPRRVRRITNPFRLRLRLSIDSSPQTKPGCPIHCAFAMSGNPYSPQCPHSPLPLPVLPSPKTNKRPATPKINFKSWHIFRPQKPTVNIPCFAVTLPYFYRENTVLYRPLFQNTPQKTQAKTAKPRLPPRLTFF